MTHPPTKLVLAGRTAELARARHHVASWASAAGLSDAASRRLVMAVDETAANAIEHGMDGREDTEVALHATLASDVLTISVRHRGPRFDPTIEPTLSPAESVKQRAPHGYGLPLIRQLVDEVDYRFVRGMNELRLSVRRSAP